MKIGLNQPNGFTSHFAKDTSKYLDTPSDSKSNSHLKPQISNTKEINSIPTLTMEVLSLPSPDKTSSSLVVIPDSPKDTALSPETNPNSFKWPIKPSWPPVECMLISVSWEKSLPPSCRSTTTKSKDNLQPSHSLIFCPRPCTQEDSSLFTLLTWSLVWTRTVRESFTGMMQLVVTALTKPWPKDQVLTWSCHSLIAKFKGTTTQITPRNHPWHLKGPLNWFMKLLGLPLKGTFTLETSLRS